jgi:hypothetical protein
MSDMMWIPALFPAIVRWLIYVVSVPVKPLTTDDREFGREAWIRAVFFQWHYLTNDSGINQPHVAYCACRTGSYKNVPNFRGFTYQRFARRKGEKPLEWVWSESGVVGDDVREHVHVDQSLISIRWQATFTISGKWQELSKLIWKERHWRVL